MTSISIITVARNSAATIAETLRSVREQRVPDGPDGPVRIEHVIIDGASTDGTVDIVAREAGVGSIVVSEPDLGIYDAMNKGLALATGEVIGFLNSDDVYVHDGVLARARDVLADRALATCHADLVYVSRRDPARVVRYWRSSPFTPGAFALGWVPGHPTFFARAEVYRDVGCFDLRYRLASDFDFMLRALEQAGVTNRYVPEVWVRMRTGGVTNASMANIMTGNREIAAILREHGHPATAAGLLARKVFSRGRQFVEREPAVG